MNIKTGYLFVVFVLQMLSLSLRTHINMVAPGKVRKNDLEMNS